MELEKQIDQTGIVALTSQLQKPVSLSGLASTDLEALGQHYWATPPGWNLEYRDMSNLLPAPLRKRAAVSLGDADSFIEYVNMHKENSTVIYWDGTASIAFTAIFDDHGRKPSGARWRQHTATFVPVCDPSWSAWICGNKVERNQSDFATFLEDRVADIAPVDSGPGAADILQMALNFESRREMVVQSTIRQQSGCHEFLFAQKENAATTEKMTWFERFHIEIPLFKQAEKYRITVRLKYRVGNDRSIKFWYELIRPDLVFDVAADKLVERIRDQCEIPLLHGNPGKVGA